jgi:hypothetical protein
LERKTCRPANVLTRTTILCGVIVIDVMFAVKYLQEFSHFTYSTCERAHLLTHYGTTMKETKFTPDGILKGESANKLEESMLGIILVRSGHANISMNVSLLLD